MALRPWQEIVDLAVGVAVDDPGEDIGEIIERLNTVELAGLCRPSNDAEAPRPIMAKHLPAISTENRSSTLVIILILKGRSGNSRSRSFGR
ncbi:hypothetical protein X741_32340 [Mesorhizobium sp. LNHC229A00]|nr:hypothetical protein X741_32340 [Mesorhizobium sp. LNHC229A00]